MTLTSWQVAAMTPADLPGVQLIESESPAPWSPQQLAEELTGERGVQLVCRAKFGDQLGGFIMARLLAGEAEILKIATAREFQRQGAATLLLNAFITLAKSRGITAFHLELRATNAPARALYEKNAFEMTGRRRNYYTTPQDDALCMTLSVAPGQISNDFNP